MSTEYKAIMWAEMKPDVYGGEKCDEVIPMWEAYGDGDMDSDTFDHNIELDCKTFPPGTRVIISVPCCPDCGQEVEMCQQDEGCAYDWDGWVQNEYS